MEERFGTPEVSSWGVFTEKAPTRNFSSPMERMSAEQPRLTLADRTKKLHESIVRAC